MWRGKTFSFSLFSLSLSYALIKVLFGSYILRIERSREKCRMLEFDTLFLASLSLARSLFSLPLYLQINRENDFHSLNARLRNFFVQSQDWLTGGFLCGERKERTARKSSYFSHRYIINVWENLMPYKKVLVFLQSMNYVS